MGMGDERRPPVSPPVRLKRCTKCGSDVADTALRRCPHPAVRKAYGEDNRICLYCCRKKPCRWCEKVTGWGIYGCTYEVREDGT